MKTDILISGFGGQGLMSLGKILAAAALRENKHTTWFPSYGAEMRGGTAHCFVKIATAPIASPFIEHPDSAILMNRPSLDKFQKKIERGGLLILNQDLVSPASLRQDIKRAVVPLNTIAVSCGSVKVANIVSLGVLLSFYPTLLRMATVQEVLKEKFSGQDILKSNLAALGKGRDYVRALDPQGANT